MKIDTKSEHIFDLFAFRSFMLRHNIYDEFLEEVAKSRKSGCCGYDDAEEFINKYHVYHSTYKYIVDALLIWNETRKGFYYWQTVDMKFRKFYDKCFKYSKGYLK